MNDLVYISHDQSRTNTLRVAEKFDKKHFNVLQSIEHLECSEEFRQLNFQAADYIDQQGKPRPMFELTRDGFMFLVMGFTGREAARWKEAFIAAFNALEAKLREQPARTEYPQTGTPFDKVQAAKLGKLLQVNRGAAYAYLIDCGVTPDYVNGVLARHGGLPALPGPVPIDRAPVPLDHLLQEIPRYLDHEDDSYWFVKHDDFGEVCGGYSRWQTLRQLKRLGLLRVNLDGLCFCYPWNAGRNGTFHAIKKTLAEVAGGGHA